MSLLLFRTNNKNTKVKSAIISNANEYFTHLYLNNFYVDYSETFCVAPFKKVDKKCSYTMCRAWLEYKLESPYFQKEK